MSHPYESLPDTAFWRPAVADRDAFAIAPVHGPALSADPSTHHAILGGRFASRLVPVLGAQGVTAITPDSVLPAADGPEPADPQPRSLDTPRLMADWLEAMRQAPRGPWPPDTALLIPERTAGPADRAEEADFEASLADLERAVAALAAGGDGVRVLLAVSPLPVRATASDEHVLAANARTKAVLRAAAAELVETRSDVSYLPLFELVTQPATEGRFLSRDGRSVTPEGLSRLARHILAPPARDGEVAPDGH